MTASALFLKNGQKGKKASEKTDKAEKKALEKRTNV